MEEKIIQLEHDMWEAALHRNLVSFRNLVMPNAVMICGGYRCLGNEYAELITDFNISGYTISNMEVVCSGENEVALHYVLKVDVESSRDKDLEGLFHVASIWKRSGEGWKLIFNMDSRIVGQ